MTAVMEPENEVEVATPDDLREAIRVALERAGCTFDELVEQARSDRFDSLAARVAWTVIGDLYGVEDIGASI